MLFKTKVVLLLVFAFSSVSVGASSWPYDVDTLRNTMETAYSSLESKTGFCRESRGRKLTEIKSDWLYALPELKQKLVLRVVGTMAFERCRKSEKTRYTIALINYTTESGDETYLERWLLLNKMYYDKEMIKILSDVDDKKISELSNTPELYYPFNIMNSYKLIVPE